MVNKYHKIKSLNQIYMIILTKQYKNEKVLIFTLNSDKIIQIPNIQTMFRIVNMAIHWNIKLKIIIVNN
jgi:hypothetical protein